MRAERKSQLPFATVGGLTSRTKVEAEAILLYHVR